MQRRKSINSFEGYPFQDLEMFTCAGKPESCRFGHGQAIYCQARNCSIQILIRLTDWETLCSCSGAAVLCATLKVHKVLMPPVGSSSPVEDRPASAAAAAAEEKELDDAPPDVRLLVKRRQMFEVQEALEAQKEQYTALVRPQSPRLLHSVVC
jgi:hypothetical protein